MKRHFIQTTIFLLLILALALAGCASNDANPSSQGQPLNNDPVPAPVLQLPTDPVTLKLYVNVVRLADVEYEAFFLEPLRQKLPHITLEKIVGELDHLVTAGDIPDIIVSDNDWHMPLKQLQLPADHTELVKKFNLDLDKFNPAAIQAVQNLEPGQLQGIPFSMNQGAMFYNRDLFDRFGVDFPTDDMLWSEVMELHRRLTRVDDGVQYVGIDLRFPDHMVSPYTQPFVDPVTNKALVDIPIYRQVLELFDQMYKTPGFVQGTKYAYGPAGFVTQHVQAMQPDWVTKIISDLLQAEADGVAPNWDMVTNPTFEDKVGVGRHALTDMLIITQASKHKDQAMQVIEMVVSREGQTELSKHSRVTALNDPEIMALFGTNNPTLADKNTASIFKNPSSPTPPPHIADKEVQSLIRAIRREMSVVGKDINTALREAQEEADKRVAEVMAR